MADLKISQLNALSGSDLAAADLVATVDSSASETKKLTISDLISNGVTLISDDTIPGAKILFGAGDIAAAALADSAVTTAKIAGDAVTAAKIADEATVDLVTTLPASGGFIGQLAVDTDSSNKLYAWDGSEWLDLRSSASINTINGSTTGAVNITATTSGDTVTIAATLDDTTAANQFLAGPASGGGAVSYRAIAGSDIPVATTTAKGGVIVNGEGLRMDTNTIEVDNDVTASTLNYVVTYNSKGLVTGGRAITAADLPAATSSAKGAVLPGSGLSVAVDGTLNHSNSVTAGTFTKLTIDAQGHVTTGASLIESDIPSLPASKITSGTISSSLLASDAVTAPKLADNSVAKFGGAGATDNIVTFPDADFKGQFFFDEKNEDLYLYNGNAYKPITIISGNLVNAGTYNASTNVMTSVTTAGSAAGFAASSALPSPAASNLNYYVVVGTSGTGSGAAPAVSLAPPDMLVSLGAGTTTYSLIDVSNAVAGQTAGNISVTAVGGISSTDVQAALQELDTEKLTATGGTVTGDINLGAGVDIIYEGSTANEYETTITVTDPTADRTITFGDETGTVLTTGASGAVTSAMIADGAIVNADINASAEIAVSKLANGTARQLLQTDSGGTGVEFTSNIDIPGTLDVTGAATFDGAGTFAGLLSANAKLSFDGGTAALPGIYPDTDTNTGVYSPGADQLAFSTNGTSRVEIDNSGNVTINGQGDLRLADSDSSNYVGLQSPTTVSSNVVFTVPGADGSAGQFIKTDGSGALSFADIPDNVTTWAVGTSATAATNTDLDVSGTYAGNVVAVSQLAIDCSAGNYFTKTISANSAFSFTSVPTSRAYACTVEIETTGSYTISWPSSVKFPSATAPTLTAGKTHVFFFCTKDGGTNFYAASLVDYTNDA